MVKSVFNFWNHTGRTIDEGEPIYWDGMQPGYSGEKEVVEICGRLIMRPYELECELDTILADDTELE